MTAERYQVIYAPEAWEDLKAIYRYIANEFGEKGTAKQQIDRIRKKIRELEWFPAKFRMVDWTPWSEMKMHQMPVDRYMV